MCYFGDSPQRKYCNIIYVTFTYFGCNTFSVYNFIEYIAPERPLTVHAVYWLGGKVYIQVMNNTVQVAKYKGEATPINNVM